ncbi:unnamed protein product [Sphagnum balticum]
MAMVGRGEDDDDTTRTTTYYGRFLDSVMVGAGWGGPGGGEDDDTWAFSRPGDGERDGRNVVGIARSKEEKRLMCTASI